MKKNFWILLLATSTFGIMAESTFAQADKGKLEGKWEVTPEGKNLQFELRGLINSGDNNWTISERLIISELDAYKKGQNVVFYLKRPAGEIKFTGSVNDDQGDGSFVFTPNIDYKRSFEKYGYNLSNHVLLLFAFKNQDSNYVKELENLGYRDVSENNLVALTALDISIAYITEIKNAGYNDIPMGQLIAFKAQNINPGYIAKMKKLSGGDISANEIISFAAMGIDERYVADMNQTGYKLSGNQLIEFKALGITPEYVRELGLYKLKGLDASNIVQLKAQDVTPSYIDACKKMGFKDLSISEIVQLKIFNIDRAYVDQIKAEGYPDITLEQIIQFRIFHIDKTFIKKSTDFLGSKPSPEKLIQLKSASDSD